VTSVANLSFAFYKQDVFVLATTEVALNFFIMAKDPAFLFYPNDFDCATRFFTNEQVGLYLRLLIAQFQNGRLSEKHINIICKTHDEDVISKFLKDDKGLYYNERLENEVVKRKNYSESRRKNRKNKEKICESYVPHMENENTLLYNNTNKEICIPIFEKVYETFKFKGGTKEMAEAFFNKHNALGWRINNTPISKWEFLVPSFILNWNKNEEDRKARKSPFQQPDPTKIKIKLPSSPTPRYD